MLVQLWVNPSPTSGVGGGGEGKVRGPGRTPKRSQHCSFEAAVRPGGRRRILSLHPPRRLRVGRGGFEPRERCSRLFDNGVRHLELGSGRRWCVVDADGFGPWKAHQRVPASG